MTLVFLKLVSSLPLYFTFFRKKKPIKSWSLFSIFCQVSPRSQDHCFWNWTHLLLKQLSKLLHHGHLLLKREQKNVRYDSDQIYSKFSNWKAYVFFFVYEMEVVLHALSVNQVVMNRQASSEVVKASDKVEDVQVETADISSKFKFFETYKEPEKQKRTFRITPPREGQVKVIACVCVLSAFYMLIIFYVHIYYLMEWHCIWSIQPPIFGIHSDTFFPSLLIHKCKLFILL